jgi:hypothetical protein
VDVQVPAAVVGPVKCIVKVSETACGFVAWATSGKTATDASEARETRAVSLSFNFSPESAEGSAAAALPSCSVAPT